MKVTFRKITWKDDKMAEIVAIFPEQMYNERLYGNRLLDAYVHLGQHTSIDKEFLKERESDLAKVETVTEEEYKPLLDELVSIGYDNLEIV